MDYISTRGGIPPVSFLEAVGMGLADDGGLLLPATIPDVRGRLAGWRHLPYATLATEILGCFVGKDLSREQLSALTARSYASFDDDAVVPLHTLAPDLHVCELFHGPTLAFKDMALQLLGNLFELLIAADGNPLTIVGATSGDTGSAAIHGVRGKEGIQIFIMHPHERVSPLQARQMTTVLDANVHNIAIQGSFDDGQRMLKELFADLAFKERHRLAAVNSVNWARVAAQIVYYFYAAFRVADATGRQQVRICVPTGNFGNILAGYLACRMGAPISKLILATNRNDILSRFFNTGIYRRGNVFETFSPSMDIQVASNFERYLYYWLGEDSQRLRQAMEDFRQRGDLGLDQSATRPHEWFAAGTADDRETIDAIRRCHEAYGYVPDPHTAVGLHVAEALRNPESPIVCLATAHPAKFPDAVAEALGNPVHHPRLDALTALPTRCTVLAAEEPKLRRFIEETLSAVC